DTLPSRPGSGEDTSIRAVGPDQAGDALAPRLAKAIVVTVYCCFCLVAFIPMLYLQAGPLKIVESLTYMASMLALQLFYLSWRTNRLRLFQCYAALLVQACLAYLPILQFKQAWVALPGFLAGGALLALPP